MVRLTHLSGSLQGTSSMSPKAVIRIGRGAACDVRFDPQVDTRVSAYHAEIRFSKGHYVIVDVGSSNGTLLNGKMVRQHRLRSGDKRAKKSICEAITRSDRIVRSSLVFK